MVSWYLYLAVVGAGFAAGYINTLAGSGSLITLPLLMFLGLPANVANGTNRVNILFQTVVGVGSFRQQGVLSLRRGLFLAVPAVVGSLLGARIAVNLNEQMMRTTIGALMLVMVVVILVRPGRWLEGRPDAEGERLRWMELPVFFVIGLYGGFIQAGVGIFLLAGLVLGAGFDLVRANAVKVLIVLCYTPFAMAVFLAHDQIRWGVGLLMAAGSMGGAWVASRMGVKRGTGFVRWVLIAVVLVAAAKLLGVFGLAARPG
jgi:uncharacterized membrane protein YfcA